MLELDMKRVNGCICVSASTAICVYELSGATHVTSICRYRWHSTGSVNTDCKMDLLEQNILWVGSELWYIGTGPR